MQIELMDIHTLYSLKTGYRAVRSTAFRRIAVFVRLKAVLRTFSAVRLKAVLRTFSTEIRFNLPIEM
jgi:hypothetical protein